MSDTDQPNIVFASAITPDKAIIHDDETFQVQWSAFNAGLAASPAFTDLLVITSIPEGCPGSDDQDHSVVYNSDSQGNPQDFLEQPLAPGQEGSTMQPMVGPFPAGSYRLTITLAVNVSNTTNYSCIDIESAS
jgi:hypothetical protein